MAFEKEALEYIIGPLDEIKDLEEVKERFNGSYLKRDQAHLDEDVSNKVFGRVKGGLRSKIKTHGRELELDAKWDEIDPGEGIEMLATTAKQLRAELAEAKKGGKAAPKEVEELERRYKEASGLVGQYKEQLTTWEKKYNDLEGSVKQRETQARVDAQYERAFGAVEFPEGTSKFTIEGFKNAFRQRYAPQFDEDGNPYAIDAESKKRITDPRRAGAFLGLDALAKQYAEEEKLIGGAPQGRTPVQRTVNLMSPQPAPHPSAPAQTANGRRVMPR
jgi:hypothetical protein